MLEWRNGRAVLVLAAMVGAPVSAWSDQAVPDTTTCLIQPFAVVELGMPVDGIVSEIAVDRGDRVEAGQVVVRLDVSLEEIEVEAALARSSNNALIEGRQARLRFLELEADRATQLVERSAAAERVSEEARMAVETARADLAEAVLEQRIAAIDARAAATRMQRKTVRSPIAGVVTERQVDVGEFKAAGEPLVTVARIDRLRAEAFVPIAFHPALKPDQQVTVIPEAPFEGEHAARITVIDRVFDAATGTFGIVVDLPNPNLELPAGLRCRIRFD